MLITEKNALKRFYTDQRLWQGIPALARSKNGRIFATFYSGKIKEEYGNYSVVITSNDDGATWREPIAVAYNGDNSRCFDSNIWIDPYGRLWFFWNVMPDFKLYAAVCDNPDDETLVWKEPRVIANGIMINKPTAISRNDWLLPIAVWAKHIRVMSDVVSKDRKRLAFAYKTNDAGKTFFRLGGVDMPQRSFDEHLLLSHDDGTLAMYVRTFYGIGVSYSYDGGLSWTPGEDSGLGGPCSRFFIRKLSSGNVLLVNHVNFCGRNNLTAMISSDDGKTFRGGLLLDERDDVSYPDGVEDEDGNIYIIYDRERGAYKHNLAENQKCARELLLARFTENDVLAGRLISEGSYLKRLVNKLGKYRGEDRNPYRECKYYTAEEYADILLEMNTPDEILSRIFNDYSSCWSILTEEENTLVDKKIAKIFNDDSSLAVKHDLLADIVKIFRKTSDHLEPSNDLIKNVIDYIDSSYHEDLQITDIADKFNVSKYYLSHLFKSHMNISLLQFVNSRRIVHAKQLLRDTDKSIIDVCFSVGFNDVSYFTKVFRLAEGISPGKYRKTVIKDKSTPLTVR